MSKFGKVLVLSIVASFLSVTGLTSVASAADLGTWQKDVNKAIAKKQSYPRAALRKEIEGQVRVEINVDREGNIVAHSLKTSSGHDVLDKEVPKLMKRVSPLPVPPAGVNDSELTMVVPLAWSLQ